MQEILKGYKSGYVGIVGKPNSNFKPRDQNPKSRRTDPRHPEAPEQR